MMKIALMVVVGVLLSACGGEPPVEVTESALGSVNVPGRYRSDSRRGKCKGSICWSSASAAASISVSAPQALGSFHAFRQNTVFTDFPGDCTFDMIAYQFNFTSAPYSSPPGAFPGPQTVWGNQQGSCVCNQTAMTLPAGSVWWYQTNSGTGYLVERASFSMCGYSWSLPGGALYPN